MYFLRAATRSCSWPTCSRRSTHAKLFQTACLSSTSVARRRNGRCRSLFQLYRIFKYEGQYCKSHACNQLRTTLSSKNTTYAKLLTSSPIAYRVFQATNCRICGPRVTFYSSRLALHRSRRYSTRTIYCTSHLNAEAYYYDSHAQSILAAARAIYNSLLPSTALLHIGVG